jgi:hypothetical protein
MPRRGAGATDTPAFRPPLPPRRAR